MDGCICANAYLRQATVGAEARSEVSLGARECEIADEESGAGLALRFSHNLIICGRFLLLFMSLAQLRQANRFAYLLRVLVVRLLENSVDRVVQYRLLHSAPHPLEV